MKISISEALDQTEEENVTCLTCTAPLSEDDDTKGDGYCRSCRDYWTHDALLMNQLEDY